MSDILTRQELDECCPDTAAEVRRLQAIERAFEYVLPFVNVDVRDKALQIASGHHQPHASHE